MSIFQRAKVHKNPSSRSLDIRILVSLLSSIENACKFKHLNFDRVFLSVPFAIPSLYQSYDRLGYMCFIQNVKILVVNRFVSDYNS